MKVHPVLRYTMLRLTLFVVVLVLLSLTGARGLLLLALAVLISGLASFILLSGQRDELSGALAGRIERIRKRIDEGARAEDFDEPSESGPAAAARDETADGEGTSGGAVDGDVPGEQRARG